MVHNPVSLLMNRSMMPPAERDQIRQRGRPAVRPMLHVVTLQNPPSAAREATRSIAMVEGAPQRRRDRARASADLDDPAIRVVPHHHAARIAGETPGNFRGNS